MNSLLNLKNHKFRILSAVIYTIFLPHTKVFKNILQLHNGEYHQNIWVACIRRIVSQSIPVAERRRRHSASSHNIRWHSATNRHAARQTRTESVRRTQPRRRSVAEPAAHCAYGMNATFWLNWNGMCKRAIERAKRALLVWVCSNGICIYAHMCGGDVGV